MGAKPRFLALVLGGFCLPIQADETGDTSVKL